MLFQQITLPGLQVQIHKVALRNLRAVCHRPCIPCRLDGLRIMMEFPKPKDDDEQAAENITERKQVHPQTHWRCVSLVLLWYIHCCYKHMLPGTLCGTTWLLHGSGADSREGL